MGLATQARASGGPQDTVAIDALRQELERARGLSIPGSPRPHHIALTLVATQELNVEASFGALVRQQHARSRLLKAEVRVGDASLDSSNFLGDQPSAVVAAEVVLEDDPHALRREAWLLLDRSYKLATSAFEAKRAYRQGRSTPTVGQDWTPAPVEQQVAMPGTPRFDSDPLAQLVQSASQVFAGYPELDKGKVQVTVRRRLVTLVDSEGRAVRQPSQLVRLQMAASTRAPDGMPLTDYATRDRTEPGSLEPDAVRSMAQTLAQRLTRLRTAPVMDQYAGPVLFEGEAAAQLMRYLVADELGATPLPEPRTDQVNGAASRLADRAGARILPVWADVWDNPLQSDWQGQPLWGTYQFDDEGVRGQRVRVVDGGRLLEPLWGRMGLPAGGKSNGHGRAGPASDARGRVANLLFMPRKGWSGRELRQRLLALARAEGLDHAMVVQKLDEPSVTEGMPFDLAVAAGETALPPPLVILRLHADGREELVRGARLGGLRPRDVRQIEAMGTQAGVYNYWASSSPVARGASFGGDIPSSVVCPSVLMPDVDVQLSTVPHARAPVLSRGRDRL